VSVYDSDAKAVQAPGFNQSPYFAYLRHWQLRQEVKQRSLRFPILLDTSGEVARQWYSQQTPRCYLIAPDRALLYRGAIDNFKHPRDNEYLAYLEPAIAAFLAGEPIPRAETASFGCPIQTVYYQLPKQL